MSLDLDWDLLDEPLASSILAALNRTFERIERPSFIGPVQVHAFDFGSAPPDVELVDMRDIYPDFLEDDDEDEESQEQVGSRPHSVAVTPPHVDATSDDEYEWVSRRHAPPGAGTLSPAYHALPPHIRYGPHGLGVGPRHVPDMFASVSSLHSPRGDWSAASSVTGFSPARYRSPFALGPLAPFGAPLSFPPSPMRSTPPSIASPPSPPPPNPVEDVPAPKQNSQPDMQLHLRINWPSNMRLTLTTSLIINVPSPSFLALPIRLTITGLLFTGELVVGYEGSRRRMHLCIVDELDPYCPLSSGPPGAIGAPGLRRTSTNGSFQGDDHSPEEEEPTSEKARVGQRVLPRITIESEIGQADKHVLRNVRRVERFVQDVIRETLENELVFPNFHTVVMAEPES
jgi:mitochondrial distribution and morphology protein 12